MIGAAINKDTWLLVRDRGALVSLFVLPLVFIITFGSIFEFGPDQGGGRAIATWHEPGDPRGELITRALATVPGFTAAAAPTPEEVRRRVARDVVPAGLVVPVDPAAPVEIVLDTAQPAQVRGPLEGALTAVVMRALDPPSAQRPLVEVRSPPGVARPLAGITSFQVSVPGNAVLFGFFLALTVAMAFTVERRSGTWRRLLAAPVPRWKALLATLVPYYLIGCVQLAFLFGVGAAAFGMQVAGSVVALIVLSLAVVYGAVALGLLFAAVGGSERQLGGIGSVVLLVMGMLGGCMVPRLMMPAFMKTLGLGVPHGWALDGYYDVLVREGTTLLDVAPALAALLAFGTAFAATGLALFRFERS